MSDIPRIVVIGSANRDLVVQAESIPMPGETVLGGTFSAVSGGKGANQAVAAARLGAKVSFVGCVGADPFGAALRDDMVRAGIDVTYLREVAQASTGVALIGVDAQGQNAILVAPGANSLVCAADIEGAREVIAGADTVLLQLEIPMESVAYAVALAASTSTRVILNPAPVRGTSPLTPELLGRVSVLTPNEHEAASLLGYASAGDIEMEQAARELLDFGVACVVITLGENGCLLATRERIWTIPAVRVSPIDTTAAGDCFTAALAVGLAEGLILDDAAKFACRAAALSVTRAGAQPSLPTRGEVVRFAI